MALDPNNIVDQMRLMTGDYIDGEPYLEDAVYLWFYESNGNSLIDACIEALESIINHIALSPASWTIDEASETKQTMESLERRLHALRAKGRGNKPPMIIGTDRKNWHDFEAVFGK